VSKLVGAKRDLVKPGASAPIGDKEIIVVRTFPKWLPPGGEHTIYGLIANAIKNTKRFIYLEDQYLIANTRIKFGRKPMSTLLAEKLIEPDFESLIILVARTEWLNRIKEMGDPRQGWLRRRLFIGELVKASSSKLTVCTYKATESKRLIDGNYPSHIHLKTWVFDDSFAVFGSANCDRAGYTFLPEVDVGITDKNEQENRLLFAHELCIDLWPKHLNGDGFSAFRESDVSDSLNAGIYWQRPLPQSRIERYDVNGGNKLREPNLEAADASDPRPHRDWDTAWGKADQDGS
jgi:phosphatidylserine/phosphatidylglycerophosphate/cardiolipin synthase-like enzyme